MISSKLNLSIRKHIRKLSDYLMGGTGCAKNAYNSVIKMPNIKMIKGLDQPLDKK